MYVLQRQLIFEFQSHNYRKQSQFLKLNLSHQLKHHLIQHVSSQANCIHVFIDLELVLYIVLSFKNVVWPKILHRTLFSIHTALLIKVDVDYHTQSYGVFGAELTRFSFTFGRSSPCLSSFYSFFKDFGYLGLRPFGTVFCPNWPNYWKNLSLNGMPAFRPSGTSAIWDFGQLGQHPIP